MNLKALHKITYGLYIVSSKKGDRFNGQIANTVFQITSDPPTIAVSINKENLTHEFISESKLFTVSVLSVNAPMSLIGKFGFRSGRDIDKFENVTYKLGRTGIPLVLEHTIAHLEAEVISSFDAGTHTVFLGKVVNAEITGDEEPMTYDYYHKVKKGKAPKTAPTYIKEEGSESKVEAKPKKFVCKVCGYVYDPISSNTPFEALPDDWVCPICGAPKSEFEPVI